MIILTPHFPSNSPKTHTENMLVPHLNEHIVSTRHQLGDSQVQNLYSEKY